MKKFLVCAALIVCCLAGFAGGRWSVIRPLYCVENQVNETVEIYRDGSLVAEFEKRDGDTYSDLVELMREPAQQPFSLQIVMN